MENERERYGLSERFFEICKEKIGKSKRYLTNQRDEGVYNSEWRIIVPKNIFSLKNGDLLDADILSLTRPRHEKNAIEKKIFNKNV